MKALNFDYEENTSNEVKHELDDISCLTQDDICNRYCIDPEDVSKFISMMRDDLETLFFEEREVYFVDDRNEEYAQSYNFL